MTNLYRSLLFVPADRPDRIKKAAGLRTDVVVIELEDGVAPDRKTMARDAAAEALQALDFGTRSAAVRVNRIATVDGIADLAAMAGWPRKPDLLILPKVESAGEVRIYDGLLTEMRADCALLPLLESCRGLRDAYAIAEAGPRVSAIALGSADLAAEMGCRPEWEPMLAARSTLGAAAAAAGVPAIDPPYLNIKDTSGLLEESRRVRDLGFSGKMCIHPSQLDTVNQAFSPTPEEVAWAQNVMEAAKAGGGGAVMMKGCLVDEAVLKSARRTLDLAERVGGQGGMVDG